MDAKSIKSLVDNFERLCESVHLISGGSGGVVGVQAVAASIRVAGDLIKEGLETLPVGEIADALENVSSSVDEHVKAMNNIADAIKEVASALRNK